MRIARRMQRFDNRQGYGEFLGQGRKNNSSGGPWVITMENKKYILAASIVAVLLAGTATADIFSTGVFKINATQGLLVSNAITALFVNTTTGNVGIGTLVTPERLSIAGNISFANGPKIMDDAGRLKIQAGGATGGVNGSGS